MSYSVTISGNTFSVGLTEINFPVTIEQLSDAEITSKVTATQTAAANAQTAQGDAEAARDASQSARDTAEDHKLAAEAAATSATNTAAALTGFDLDAVAETKAVTAVDVFVYDTSKDSDGGAWRKRTQGTSWYNETLNTATRGSRREFPAVAVIVAESNKITIYDGDDPALPMWATQGSNVVLAGIKAVTAKNGIVSVATTLGYLAAFNFVTSGPWLVYDTGGLDTYSGTIWSDVGSPISTDASKAIVNNTVNDVAMTVLPDAPTNPATGLPVPTIAVATDGNGTYSTSVITDDGTVYDIASDSTGTAVSVAFDGVSLSVIRSDGAVYVWDDVGAITTDGISPDATYSASSTPALLGTVSKVAA